MKRGPLKYPRDATWYVFESIGYVTLAIERVRKGIR